MTRDESALADPQKAPTDPKSLEAVMAESLEEWVSIFDRRRSQCCGDLKRFGPSGIEGTMTCTNMTDGETGADLPVTDVRFSATPVPLDRSRPR